MSDVPNMNDLLAQAMAMQQKMQEAQAEASNRVFEGVAGGGMVRVEITGTMDFRRFRIDPKVVDPADVTMLEDLLLAAVNDATAKISAQNAQTMSGFGLDGLLGG